MRPVIGKRISRRNLEPIKGNVASILQPFVFDYRTSVISLFRVETLQGNISIKRLDISLISQNKESLIEIEELNSNISDIKKEATLVPKNVIAYAKLIELSAKIGVKMIEANIDSKKLII